MTKLFKRSADVIVGDRRLNGLDCAFEIEKTLRPEPNRCSLKIFNLSEQTRSSFEQLAPRKRLQTTGIPVRIEAGYGDDRAVLWRGDLRNVFTEIEGPDWVTSMDSGDAHLAYSNSRVNLSYGPATPVDTVLKALVGQLGIGVGNLSDVLATLKVNGIGTIYPHNMVLSGSVAQELTDFCTSAGLEWSIQDGVLQILDRGAALRGKAVLVSSDSGLVGSPSVDVDGIATFKTLMLPAVRVGSIVQLNSERVKGAYRIEKATWSGDTSSTDWYITIQASRYPKRDLADA